MNYDEYVNTAQQAGQAYEAGQHEEALTIFRTLIASDISDLDKAMMYRNMGVIQEELGREQDALSSYERGSSYERMHGRINVAEMKASYLYRLGRLAESLREYEGLLLRPSLTEEEKNRLRYNAAAIRNEIG
jgi:tetratricopeptide (TPR) repeat protein